MRTEVLHDGLVVVCSVTKRGNTRKRSEIRFYNIKPNLDSHYFRTFSPVLSLDFRRSVLSVEQDEIVRRIIQVVSQRTQE